MALAGLLCLGQSALAQEVVEETAVATYTDQTAYYEDASQGLLLNPFKCNWFITAQGGASVLFSHADAERDFQYRIQPAASLYVGKWFSPVIGLRGGVDWYMNKGYSELKNGIGVTNPNTENGGYYTAKYMNVGPVFDAMINLTNWWCGYNPKRVYNCTAYVGAGIYFTLARKIENGERTGYKDTKDKVLTGRAGIINTFHLNNRWDLSLDIRGVVCDGHVDQADQPGWNHMEFDLQAYLGVTYNFGKTTWNGPIIPICPPAEDCSAYQAALAAAEARIADLESQLKDCLNRPVEVIEEDCNAPLCTIYFPINVAKLTREDVRVLNAVANIMKDNDGTNYVVTGWADNYTGNDAINTSLRERRADAVAKQLVKDGVEASRITTTINSGNLYGNNKNYMVLDRAATIQVAK